MVFDGWVANISRCRMIAARPQAVWDVLADLDALSSWADNIDHSCTLNHGPNGGPLGATRRIQVGRLALVDHIIEFEPLTTLAYRIEGLPSRLRTVINRWSLRPAGATGAVTLATLTSTVEIGLSQPARLAERAALRVLAKQSDALLAGLAHRLENPHV